MRYVKVSNKTAKCLFFVSSHCAIIPMAVKSQPWEAWENLKHNEERNTQWEHRVSCTTSTLFSPGSRFLVLKSHLKKIKNNWPENYGSWSCGCRNTCKMMAGQAHATTQPMLLSYKARMAAPLCKMIIQSLGHSGGGCLEIQAVDEISWQQLEWARRSSRLSIPSKAKSGPVSLSSFVSLLNFYAPENLFYLPFRYHLFA